MRPAAVRIDDLADPVFPDEVAGLRAVMHDLGAELSLEPAELLAEASRQAGMEDFGDPSFRERLDVLCRALRTEAGLSTAGVLTWHALLTQLLRNRLLIEETLRQHPEIHDLRVERPIVICGLPRTGTTHLHNLLSVDTALRSLPYWESLEPLLHPDEVPAVGEPDPRIARTEAALDVVNSAMPLFRRMHEMTVDHVHEEIQLLAIDLSTMLFETQAAMPSWRDYYLAHDQTPRYEYLASVLKVLQWARGGTRWVLKSPQHVEQFGPLATVFPDATFVVTHRDPVAVTLSVATMIAYTARLAVDPVDPRRIGRYWLDRIERMLRACVRDHDLLPPAQTIDVHFTEFMADDMAMVERIYAVADQPMTPTAREAMAAFVADHPRGRHGGVLYDFGAVGLDRHECERTLAFYVDHFGVAREPA